MDRNYCPPPATDDPIDRHQYYAKVSCNIIEANRDVDGLGKKVSGMYERLDMIGDKVKEYATKGNTIIACISVLWLILGSGLTMYVNSVIDAAKHTVEQVSELDKKVALLESTAAANAAAVESIEKIKRNIATLQKEVEERRQ